MAFINKMDRTGADFRRCIKEMQDRLAANPAVLHLPIGAEDKFEGIIDLVEMKALFYAKDPTVVEVKDIPANMLEEAQEARNQLIEALADVDDSLIEAFLEGQDVSAATLRKVLRRGTIDLKIVPVFLGSAFKNKGVQALLDGVVDLLPSPLDIPPVSAINPKGELVERKADDSEPFSALAFKLMTDPYVGHLTFLRIYSGTLNSGDQVYNSGRETREKIGRLLKMHANKREEIKEAYAGDIVAAVGLRNSTTGDTLCNEAKSVILEKLHIPEPVIHIALSPASKDDQEKLSTALGKLASEDPSFRVRTDEETGETIISGMGELHLEIIVDRLLREFKVNANMGAPQVAYRETITKTVEVQGKHVRQSGGRGQYGDVWLRLEPMEPGSGLIYETAVVGGTVPKEYHSAVGEGALEAARKGGVKAGFPVTDVKVTLFDGSYHDVDSSEMAFHIAGSIGFKDGMRQAKPILLEPIMDLEVVTPEDHVGDVMGDISSRRGRVSGMEAKSGSQIITAEVPLSTMFGYSTELRSRTQGRATFTMQFGRYQPMPESVAADIVAAREAKKAADSR
ncbi:MAG: elongation factor G, partial [Candidatus Adiutrix sp.]